MIGPAATALACMLALLAAGCTGPRNAREGDTNAASYDAGSAPVMRDASVPADSGREDPADSSWGPDRSPPSGDAGRAAHDAGRDAGIMDAGTSVDDGTTPIATGHPRRFVLSDEPLRKILYVNLDDPTRDWDLDVPGGARDLQLIGNGLLLVGTQEGSGGYHEVDLVTGKIVKSVLGFGRVMAVRRLPNGNTLLIGQALKGGSGTVVLEVNAANEIVQRLEFPTLSGGRLIRRTADGNYLVGSTSGTPGKDVMVEITPGGKEVQRLPIQAQPAYMGLRTAEGRTVVSTGHGGSLLVFDEQGTVIQTIGGPRAPEAELINPHHFSQFQIMPNGHYVVSNWQGHERSHGADGRQLLEYDAQGTLLWSWDQDPTRISSLHGVIVLDGLDLAKLHDDVNGVLAPVR